MRGQVVELLVLLGAALDLFQLAELGIVASDNEQQVDDEILEEIHEAEVENIPSCFLEHACHRDLLDASVVTDIVLEGREVFLNLEKAALSGVALTGLLISEICKGCFL